MKVNELKRILKPLIKECVREVILEQKGALSHIVTEVVSGLANSQELIQEERNQRPLPPPDRVRKEGKQPPKQDKQLAQLRKEMLAKVNGSAYKEGEMEFLEEDQQPLPELPQQAAPPPTTKKEQKLVQFKERNENRLAESLGINVFEGTNPLDADEQEAEKGVDLDVFQNMGNWKQIANGKK